MSQMPHSPYLHTVDVVVMRYISAKSPKGVSMGLKKDEIQVLVHKRDKEPFMDAWALPGLVVNGSQQDASITDAARRLMRSEKVGFEPLYMEQVGTEGNAVRDPRCWSSTTFYMAFVDPEQKIKENQAFIPLDDIICHQYKLPFDHNLIVINVAERLYSKSLYSSLPLLMLGRQITLTEATEVTSCIVGKEVRKSSMRARLDAMIAAGYLEETQEKKASTVGRSQVLINNLKLGEVFFFERCIER